MTVIYLLLGLVPGHPHFLCIHHDNEISRIEITRIDRLVLPFEKLIEKHPTRIIEHAVRGMLPKNPLGRAMFRKLKVYDGPTHPHGAQIKEASKAEEG